MLRHIADRRNIDAAIRTIRMWGIPFIGPITTAKKKRIYLVGECILTEPELMALNRSGKFAAEEGPEILLELSKSLIVTKKA